MEWLNKSYSYVKNICLFAVIMFFVLRTFVVNTSGYTKCTSMTSYGEWKEEGWSSSMCVSRKYASARDLKNCLSSDVRMVMMGGEYLKLIFDRLTTELGREEVEYHKITVEEDESIHFTDKNGSINVTFYHQSTTSVETVYQRILNDKEWFGKRTVIFHSECEDVDRKRTSDQHSDITRNLRQQLKKQKLFLKKSPLSTIVMVPLDSQPCSREMEEVYSASPVVRLLPLSAVDYASSKASDVHWLGQVLDLMFNCFCNEKLPSGATCCVAKQRTSTMNIIIGILTLIIAFYAGMKMLLVTDTLKGILPLLGVSFPKGQKGIGEYAHHPALQVPNKLGAIAMVTTYILVSSMTYLMMEGPLVVELWNVILIIIAISVVTLVSVRGNEEKDVWLSEGMVYEGQGLAVLGILVTELVKSKLDLNLAYVTLRLCTALLLFFSAFDCFATFANSTELNSRRISQAILRVLLLPIAMWVGSTSSSFIFNVLVFIFINFGIVVSCAYVYSITRGVQPMINKKHQWWMVCPLPLLIALFIAFIVFVILSQVYVVGVSQNVTFDLSKWEFDITSDSMSVFYGMVVGVMVILSRDGKGVIGTFSRVNKWALIGTSTLLCLLCIASLSAYVVVSDGNNHSYQLVHYIFSPLLICSYMLTRNSTPLLRSIQSNALCYLGNIAYEVFLLYHCVFLSGEDKHALYIFPHLPAVNTWVLFGALLIMASCLRDVYQPDVHQSDSAVKDGHKSTRSQV